MLSYFCDRWRSASLVVAAILSMTAKPVLAAECKLAMMADLPVTMDGLRASVPIKVNGRDTEFWLDSGAFFSIMSAAKADEFALPLSAAPMGLYLIGIGGSASVKVATVKSFGVVGQELKNVEFLVGGSDAGNGFIGRNILAIADTEFDLAHGSVKLIKPQGCNKIALAYWAQGKPYFTVPLLEGQNPRDHRFALPVSINEAKIKAEFDTGAPGSLISRAAAERAGIDLNGPNAVPISNIGGFGRRFTKGWIVSADSISIGDEQILKARITVIDGPIIAGADSPDMLLGADYMLAHHIYVARTQRLIYFTYTGGKPFLASAQSGSGATQSKKEPLSLPEGMRRVEAVDNPGAEPKTAEEFARRGNARLAQRAFPGAIADLSEAIRLAPGNADYYGDRAEAYGQSGDGQKARADLEKALSIDPEDGELLRIRAFMRLAEQDKAGALADAEAAVKATHAASLDMHSLAYLFEKLGKPERAVPLLDKVIALHRADSALGSLLNTRCWVRALANIELDKAVADCNAAIKRNGANAAFLDSRGLAYFRSGDLAKATADYDAALKLSSKLDWSLYVRGLIKNRQGNIEGGKADMAAAVAINPDIAAEAKLYGIEQ